MCPQEVMLTEDTVKAQLHLGYTRQSESERDKQGVVHMYKTHLVLDVYFVFSEYIYYPGYPPSMYMPSKYL